MVLAGRLNAPTTRAHTAHTTTHLQHEEEEDKDEGKRELEEQGLLAAALDEEGLDGQGS